MKKIMKALSLLIAMLLLVASFAGCEKKPGLYAWYGGRIHVDHVLRLTVDVGDGEQVYDVPFETYRTVFVYLKGIVPNTVVDSEDNKKLATKAQQTAAIKEVTEDTLIEYYSLVALGEKYGISITESDKQLFENDYKKKIEAYIDTLDESVLENYEGSKEEYAEQLYAKSLALTNMTPDYLEFQYYKNLLAKRIKMHLATDIEDYLSQSYFHYKQVIALYTKGDSAAEEKARTAITEAYEKLMAGEKIDRVISAYSSSDYSSEIYFDAYGKVVGSSTADTVGTFTVSTIQSLGIGEISGIISGDEDDMTGYFAVFVRLGFDKEFICSEDIKAQAMFNYPYVNASSITPYANFYESLLDSYRENMSCTPIDRKIYNRIAINTLF